MTGNTRKQRIILWLSIAVLCLLAAGNFLFPFGLFSKPAVPNCGPEHRRWLGEHFENKAELLAYLKKNELALFSGIDVPRLDEYPLQGSGQRMAGTIDWQLIEDSIQVRQRIGYKLYVLDYQPLACPGQSYTLKVTGYGLASLFGCCGV